MFVDSCVLQWCVGTLAPALHYKAKGWDNKLQVHCWQTGRRGGGGGGGIMGGRIMSVCWREEEGGRGRSPAAANA